MLTVFQDLLLLVSNLSQGSTASVQYATHHGQGRVLWKLDV